MMTIKQYAIGRLVELRSIIGCRKVCRILPETFSAVNDFNEGTAVVKTGQTKKTETSQATEGGVGTDGAKDRQ